MKKQVKFAFALMAVVILSGCSNPMTVTEAHGIGKTEIYIDESFKPLFDTSIDTFEGQNPMAEITPKYTTEDEAIRKLLKGETDAICITRDFTEKEKADLRKSNVEVKSDLIAKDAVALIVNPENPDSTMTVDQLKRILTGQDTMWNGLKTGINVVFDNINSANFLYMRKLTENAKIPVNVFAVKSNEEVIEYVKKNKSALGVIGVNWISDEDDPQALSFRNGITVVAVAESAAKDYFKPYQAYIYTKEYPLTRELWMLNKGSRDGVNNGLVLFMIGEKGQLIIQKSSLIPAHAVARMVEITTE